MPLPIIGLLLAIFVLLYLVLRTRVHAFIAILIAPSLAGCYGGLSSTETISPISKSSTISRIWRSRPAVCSTTKEALQQHAPDVLRACRNMPNVCHASRTKTSSARPSPSYTLTQSMQAPFRVH